MPILPEATQPPGVMGGRTGDKYIRGWGDVDSELEAAVTLGAIGPSHHVGKAKLPLSSGGKLASEAARAGGVALVALMRKLVELANLLLKSSSFQLSH